MKKALFWLFAAAFAAFLFVAPRMVESSIPTIYYITPTRKSYENSVSCSGTVQAGQVQAVYLNTPAVAAQVLVSEGETVSAGQVLAVLDPEKTRTVAAASVGVSLDALESAASPGAEVDLEGLVSLFGVSALTGGSLDLSELSGILTDLQGGYQAQVVATWLDSIPQTITAPTAGVVTGLALAEGVPVSAGRAVVTIQDRSSFKVSALVPESDIAKIGVGNAAQVRCVGYASKQYSGTVTRIAPTAHKVLSGTTTETVVEVEILLDSADSSLKPGFTARVEIQCGDDYQLLTVPYESIRQDENNDEYVYVYENGKVVRATVITGQELSNEVEILYGLDTDAIVVFNPSDVVREGAIINLKGRANVD